MFPRRRRRRTAVRVHGRSAHSVHDRIIHGRPLDRQREDIAAIREEVATLRLEVSRLREELPTGSRYTRPLYRPRLSCHAVWLPRLQEAASVLVVLIAAAFLRFHELSTIPAGLHGDEAITGLEGQRILDEGWIGPYSPSALGQPTGPLYLTAASVLLFGNTIFAVRAVPAFLGLLTVLAIYFLVRRHLGPSTAIIAAAMLAVMGWHIHLTRIGFPLAAWPLIVVLSVGALLEAMRTSDWRWWAVAGGTIALGTYVYNAHPLVIAILGLFVLLWLIGPFLLRQRPIRWREYRHRMVALLIGGATSALVMVPITRFAADPDNHYFGHFRGVSIFERAAWENLANPLDRGIFLVERYATFWRRTCCDPQVNYVDGTGVVPILPLPLLVLVIVGVTIGLWRRPGPLLAVGALIVAAMPWAAVTTIDGEARRTFAMAPFLAIFAAVGIAALLHAARRRPAPARQLVTIGVALLVTMAVFRGVAGQFGQFPGTPEERRIFAQEFTTAALFMRTLPPDRHVYFYSDRWSVDYETRRFLAPNLSAEDRSAEYGEPGIAIDPAKGRPVFIFLGEYLSYIDEVRQDYPVGYTVTGGTQDDIAFVAYVIVPLEFSVQ